MKQPIVELGAPVTVEMVRATFMPAWPWIKGTDRIGKNVKVIRRGVELKHVIAANVVTGECVVQRLIACGKGWKKVLRRGVPQTYRTRCDAVLPAYRIRSFPFDIMEMLFPAKDPKKRGKNCPFARAARARINAKRALCTKIRRYSATIDLAAKPMRKSSHG
jgi:hypothetical protein